MISTCPKCQKQVSLPTGVDSTAWVRCPWCEVEYVLSEALTWIPPELILAASPAADETATEKTFAESNATDVVGDDEAAVAAAAFPAMPDAARLPPRRRRSKSGQQTLLEIILGGIAGILVAYYGLAFYLGPRFHQVGLPRLPLPFISWITAPRDDIQLEPTTEHPDRGWEKPPAEK